MKKLAVVAAVALAGACSSGPKPVPQATCETGPAWTCSQSGPCQDAENKGKLCAVGIADNVSSFALGMETASTRARVAMGAVIKTKVDGFTRAVQDSMSKAGQGEESIQKIGNVAQSVVEQTLFGVSIPKTHFNKEGKIFFAQAMVDPKTLLDALKGMKQAGTLTEEIKAEIDKRAENLVNEWVGERERANPAK
jgi:hypothetical protein